MPDAVGRILAEPVTAVLSSPNFHAAAMDGIAVVAEKTFGAHPSRDVWYVWGRATLTNRLFIFNTPKAIVFKANILFFSLEKSHIGSSGDLTQLIPFTAF